MAEVKRKCRWSVESLAVAELGCDGDNAQLKALPMYTEAQASECTLDSLSHRVPLVAFNTPHFKSSLSLRLAASPSLHRNFLSHVQ